MRIINSKPSFFETLFTLLFESEDHFLRRYSNRNFFFVFLIKKMQAKIKQNSNKVKDWKRETPLAEILFLPGNGARKFT
jgi:hypothetical protein